MAELSSSVSSLGGGATAFFPQLQYQYHVSSAGPSTGGQYPGDAYHSSFHPAHRPATLMPSELIQNCASHAAKIQEHHKENRYGTFNMPDGSPYGGTIRRGALFCRSGNWLEILDERTARTEVKKGDPIEHIRGTRTENSPFSILEFLSVAIGLVSIRGVHSHRYLCMNESGKLYAASYQNYTSDCVFMEEMLENYYNLYSSCTYGSIKRPWYVAIRKTGKPRNGKNARKRRKASHFLVVHYDLPTAATISMKGPVDLSQLLIPSLKYQPPQASRYQPPRTPKTDSKLEMARQITRRTGIDKINARITLSHSEIQVLTRKKERRKRRREERLARERKLREERRKTLERLREDEIRRRPSPPPAKLSGAGLQIRPRPPRLEPIPIIKKLEDDFR